MFLSRSETVVLAQVLAIYADSRVSVGTSDFHRATDALRKRAENSLSDLGEPPYGCCDKAEDGESPFADDMFHVEDEELVDEEAEDVLKDEEDLADEKDEAERAVSGESGEPQAEAAVVPGESKGDGFGGEKLWADIEHTCARLVKLPKLNTSLGNAVFRVSEGALQLQLNGDELVVDDVDYTKRLARALHVRDGWGEWHVFNVSKFPKAWQKTFPVNKLVQVNE
jgi:hypothetical protein